MSGYDTIRRVRRRRRARGYSAVCAQYAHRKCTGRVPCDCECHDRRAGQHVSGSVLAPLSGMSQPPTPPQPNPQPGPQPPSPPQPRPGQDDEDDRDKNRPR